MVSGVAIRAINEGTNIEAAATTDDVGRFVFTSLRPGPYRVTATANGASKSQSTAGIVLQVNQAARLDIKLAVGNVTERVTVNAEAPLLETETASRGAVIDHTKMVELPLNGRDYNQLALLSPGRAGAYATSAVRRISGGVQRQRQPRIPERIPVGRSGQYIVFE